MVKMFILLCSHSNIALLSPPSISPVATPSEEEKEHEDYKNEVHNFLQNIRREFPATHVSAELLFSSLGIYLLTAWEAVMNADGGRRPGVWHEHCAISPCKRAKLVTNSA